MGQKNPKKSLFELVPDISEIREKWSLEKLLLRPEKSAKVNYFDMYGWETKFSFKNSYRKNVSMPSFPRNQLFLILETITVIIYWNFCPKTGNIEIFTHIKCTVILTVLMISENP